MRFSIFLVACLGSVVAARAAAPGRADLVVRGATIHTVDAERPRAGAARWEWMHAARALVDAGIPVAGHSDSPVSAADPLLRIQDMATRRSAEGKVYGASQRITPAEALRAWTLGGAYAAFEERSKGSITPGKFGDFVVLAADPLTVAPETIEDIAIELTVVGGRIVHRANNRPREGDR